MSDFLICRHCGQLQDGKQAQLGEVHTCVSCGNLFTAPRPTNGSSAPADQDHMGSAVAMSVGRELDVRELVHATWTILKRQMGVVIGAVLGAELLGYLVSLLVGLLQLAAERMMGHSDGDTSLGLLLVTGLLNIPTVFASVYLNLGCAIVVLRAARGEPVKIGDMFSGGRYFVRAGFGSLLFGLAVLGGTLLCLVPGIVVAVALWPWLFVLIDKDPPGIECLQRARELTENRVGALMMVGLASLLINLLGILACCIGLIVTVPMTQLLSAVTYCRLVGHPTAEMRTSVS